MRELILKKDLIMNHEAAFSNAVSAGVFDKPKVNYWMILLPLLFLFFVYRMQSYKNGRMKFCKDFMTTRRLAMDIAFEAAAAGGEPDCKRLVKNSGLEEMVQKPYAIWVRTLVDHYMEMLKAEGDSFDTLVRSAYRNRTGYLLILNRLSMVERGFYSALKPQLENSQEAEGVIAKIEKLTEQLRRESAEEIFA